MLNYLLALPLLFGACGYIYLRRFDTYTFIMLGAAAWLYYFCFYHTGWNDFAADAQLHAGYVKFIAAGNKPTDFQFIGAYRHPPTYYLLAAGLYRLAEYTHAPEPLLIVRHLSMGLFLLFTLLSVQVLRRTLQPGKAGYYCALGIFLFWPIGVTMGGRITCDIMLYAAQMGVMYFLIRWLQEKSIPMLSGAFFASGVCMLAKNAGILMLFICACMFAIGVYERRTLRTFLKPHLFLSMVFACLCWQVTRSHGWVTDDAPAHSLPLSYLWQVLHFNLFSFIFDSSDGFGSREFFTRLLQSLLLGTNMPWKAENVQIAFHCLWLGALLYIVFGVRVLRHMPPADKRVLMLCAFVIFTLAGGMFYMLMRIGNFEYADGRYMYVAVPLLALIYAKALEGYQAQGNRRQCLLGIGIALGFPLLTCLLFGMQFF